MAAETLPKLNILLVGKTGVGKSSTANSIFGEKKCAIGVGKSVTKECTQETAKRNGIQITVIDTPGVCDTDGMDATKVIDDFITTHKCELHAICLVIAPPRPTDEEKQAIVQLKTLFGKAMLQYLFVVITRMVELEESDVQPKVYLQGFVSDKTDILQTCIQGGRVFGIDNHRLNDKKEEQVQELLDGINKMVSGNKGALYTLHNLEENKKVLEEEAKKIKQKEDEINRRKEEERKLEIQIAEAKAREEQRKRSEAERLAKEKALQEQLENEKKMEIQKAQEEAEKRLQAQKEAGQKKERELQEQHEIEKKREREERERQLKAQREEAEENARAQQEQHAREKDQQAKALEEKEKELKAAKEATEKKENELKDEKKRWEDEQQKHNEHAERMTKLENATQDAQEKSNKALGVATLAGVGGGLSGTAAGLAAAALTLNPVGIAEAGGTVAVGAAACIISALW